MSEQHPDADAAVIFPDGVRQVTCRDCLASSTEKLDFDFSMAFQPIVDN